MIFTIIELIVIIVLVAFIFIRLKPNKKENANIEMPKSIENNTNAFDEIEVKKEFGTSNSVNNYLNNNTNDFQNLNNTNMESSKDENNPYQ